MGLSVCITYPSDEAAQNQWGYVLGGFACVDVYVLGGEPDSGIKVFKRASYVDSVAELPGTLVVCASTEGRLVRGDESLVTFRHPEDAVYLFGHDHENMPAKIGDAAAHRVFIPGGQHFAHVAAGIVLYDRLVKRG